MVVVVVAGCKATRAGYESAPYKMVRRDGKFELRDYPALTVVETPMGGGGSNGANGSFNRLFRFITGNNEAKQKIAMTTPGLHVRQRHESGRWRSSCRRGEEAGRKCPSRPTRW